MRREWEDDKRNGQLREVLGVVGCPSIALSAWPNLDHQVWAEPGEARQRAGHSSDEELMEDSWMGNPAGMRGSSNVDPLANNELVEEAGCAAGNVDIVDEGIDYDALREKGTPMPWRG